MTEVLNSLESGDEISLNIAGAVYGGVVTTVFDEEMLAEETITEIEIDALEDDCISVVVDYVGEEGLDRFEATNDDYEIYAASDSFDGEQDVNAFINHEDESEAPDQLITELEDDVLAEIQPEFESAVDKLYRAITEAQEMRDAYDGFLEGRLTLQEVEEQMEELQLESGGELVLDRGL